jgi:hypothetical protein
MSHSLVTTLRDVSLVGGSVERGCPRDAGPPLEQQVIILPPAWDEEKAVTTLSADSFRYLATRPERQR